MSLNYSCRSTVEIKAEHRCIGLTVLKTTNFLSIALSDYADMYRPFQD